MRVMPDAGGLEIGGDLAGAYADVYTEAALAALHELAPFDAERRTLMDARIERRARRARDRERIKFLDPDQVIAVTGLNDQLQCTRRGRSYADDVAITARVNGRGGADPDV